MPETGGDSTQMLPLWVQWLFAIGGLTFIVAAFVAIWSRLGHIEKRIGRLEAGGDPLAVEKDSHDARD